MRQRLSSGCKCCSLRYLTDDRGHYLSYSALPARPSINSAKSKINWRRNENDEQGRERKG